MVRNTQISYWKLALLTIKKNQHIEQPILGLPGNKTVHSESWEARRIHTENVRPWLGVHVQSIWMRRETEPKFLPYVKPYLFQISHFSRFGG